MSRRGARVQVEGVFKQFLYSSDGASDKVPGFQVTADEVTLCLCLGWVRGVEYKPRRGEAPLPRETSADAS